VRKIAYVLTAYQDPEQLLRLVNALDEYADFFVHVDAKVDIVPFSEKFAGRLNVRFVDRRYLIQWGGFDQVQSQTELLRAALGTGEDYLRIVCLSGADYPTWSNAAIRAEFERHPDREEIMGLNLETCESAPQKDKVAIYHFGRNLPFANPTFRRAFSGTFRWIMRRSPFRKPIRAPIGGHPCPVHFGSDYWALSRDCAKHVHAILSGDPGFEKYFRTAFAPSELCVQTIVFNSTFRERAILKPGPEYRGLWQLTPLHHIRYGAQIAVMEPKDLAEITGKSKMFVRKLSSTRSGELYLLLEELRKSRGDEPQPGLLD
jgi:hypothetical protein